MMACLPTGPSIGGVTVVPGRVVVDVIRDLNTQRLSTMSAGQRRAPLVASALWVNCASLSEAADISREKKDMKDMF